MQLWEVRYQYYDPEYPNDCDTFWTFRIITEDECAEEAITLARDYIARDKLCIDNEPVSEEDVKKYVSLCDITKGKKIHAISDKLRDKCGSGGVVQEDYSS